MSVLAGSRPVLPDKGTRANYKDNSGEVHGALVPQFHLSGVRPRNPLGLSLSGVLLVILKLAGAWTSMAPSPAQYLGMPAPAY
jgi:hypothetical protein